MDFSYEDDDDPGANQEELLRNIHAEFRGDFPDEPAGEDPENEAHDGDSSDDGLVLLSALPRRVRRKPVARGVLSTFPGETTKCP